MHLVGGQVDFRSCAHVPFVSDQSHAPSEDLSIFTVYAAAVTSEWSPVPGTIGDSGLQMSHGSLASLTCGEPPPWV